MDPLRLLVELRGFFTRLEAREMGYDDRAVARAIRCGLWHRIHRGYYTFSDHWLVLDPVGRHLVTAFAVQHSLGDAVALSHVTGALLHNIATWGIDLRRIHVTRLDKGAGRIERGVIHHQGDVGNDVVEVGGHLVMAADRCVIETGTLGSAEAAYVSINSFLNRELGTQEELTARFEEMTHWPNTRRLHVPIRIADGGAESPGESRGIWLCWSNHLPRPETQHMVYDENGALLGTTDWWWPGHRLLGEFDGKVKYGRLLKPGQDPGEVVFAEKQREDLLRRVSRCGMVRLVWSDYDRPRTAAARIRRALEDRAG